MGKWQGRLGPECWQLPQSDPAHYVKVEHNNLNEVITSLKTINVYRYKELVKEAHHVV